MNDPDTDVMLRRVAADDPELAELIRLSDEYMSALYPAESNHLESPAALAAPNVTILGAYVGDRLAASVAAKTMDDDGVYAEIKRLFVLDAFRGRGLAKRLMDHLEADLSNRDIPLARLETGILQPEALGFYEQRGYAYRPPFASYRLDPWSVFMEKRISPPAGGPGRDAGAGQPDAGH
ncbi:MAG: GNAT family N-acetyltransferase [Gammaproteobacteria bacterium]|nr:GNAT family N-acetyltransferase [Gammaproteobacteria bacterium]MDH4255296.1 GNAT family N-acetyltransferase [Gammaproteobacteria bacterium]MDH5310936.1 GNAT family N-acetyltransferase [Gammaproteobacteria bacterium]